ncbi:MAG: hypothetical protein ACW964_08520 [Candidatus Hodarchaeales archaeon]|jgi:hypothetical protein
MKIKYPENLYCPHCKSTIALDYSEKYTARTDDLFTMRIQVPLSMSSAKDARKNKQDIGVGSPYLLLCQSCQTILGAFA